MSSTEAMQTSRPCRVLVTDADRTSSLAVIRSLGRAGHSVLAADVGTQATGARSRYASGFVRYPSPFEATVEETAAALGAIAEAHHIDVIVPVTDDVIVPLDSHRALMPPGCVVAMADHASLDRGASKVATTLLADSLGVPVPRHEVIHRPADTEGIVDRLGGPVVMKPDRSRVVGPDGRLHKGQVTYARSDTEAHEALERCGQPVIAQTMHEGVGHGIGLVFDDGRPLLAVAHRRVHEVPVTGGASARRVTTRPDPDMLAAACALLGELRWTGAAMVEFKVGPAGSAFMEINGRLWGSVPLAVLAGSDVPRLMVEVHRGRDSTEVAAVDTCYRPSVSSRNLNLELVWIASVLARGRGGSDIVSFGRRDAVRAALDLLRRGQGDDLVAADDRAPMVFGVRQAFGHVIAKAVPRG